MCPLLSVFYCNTTALVDTRCMHFLCIEQFWNTSWVFYSLTQFWHYLPGYRIRVHRSRSHMNTSLPLLQMPIASPGDHLCFWPTDYGSEIPTNTLLGFKSKLSGKGFRAFVPSLRMLTYTSPHVFQSGCSLNPLFWFWWRLHHIDIIN